MKPFVDGQKHCARCKSYKDFNLFGKNKYLKDGIGCWCKDCKKEDRLIKRKENGIGLINQVIQPMPECCLPMSVIKGLGNLERYAISKKGFVYTCARGGEWVKRKQRIDTKGYDTFCFRDKGKTQYLRIHRLICEAFIPNPENKPDVNHIDGNRANNDISNLEWVTRSENIKHSYDKLGHGRLNGTKSPKAKLDDDKVRKIRILLAAGGTIREIASIFETHHSIIQGIKQGKRWAHVV